MPTTAEWAGDTGRTWAGLSDAMERQLCALTPLGLAALAPRPGWRVLDLGCGGGATTRALAAAVGPGGAAVGLDVSPDLVRAARAAHGDAPGVSFVETDAARHPFEPGRHDALFSRLGCMFFEDPPAAFANLRTALRPGAPAVMVVFGPPERCEWATLPRAVVEAELGPPPESAAPPSPGPFAWAEPQAWEHALGGGGFRDIRAETHEVSLEVGLGDAPDPAERAVDHLTALGPLAARLAADPEAAARLRPRLAEALRPKVRDGAVRLGAVVRVVRATA